MSMVEEDVELRDLLAQALEKNGCLAKLRAELRASIFLALDEDIKLNKQQPLQNLRVQSYLETPEGKIMFCLVREFLEFFNLQFTISVYEPESYLDSIGQYEGRQKVAKDLGLDNIEEPTVPLLQQLLKIAQTKSKVLDINLNMNGNINGSLKDDSLNVDSSYKKTESCNSISRISNSASQLGQEKISKTELLDNGYLNTTFDINIIASNDSKTINYDENIDNNSLREIVLREPDSFENSKCVSDITGDISEVPINSIPKLDESSRISNLSFEKNGAFNVTYDMSSHKIDESQDANQISRNVALPKCLKDIREDDTYEDTSSIAEDSEMLEKPSSINISEKIETEVPCKTPSSSSSSENAVQTSPKISNLTKSDVDKSKLSPQRPKANLNSLSDLPPLSLNKTRVNSDILPSLYSKDFKNKSNLKELDKMFDMDADYEEDFMYSNELSLNSSPVNSSHSKNSTVEDSIIANKTDLNMLNIINKKDPKNTSKVISDVGKSVLKSSQTNCSNFKTGDHSNKSSISEYTTSEPVNSAL